MALFIGLLLFSFILTSIAIVPFIGFLYRSKFVRKDIKIAVDPSQKKFIHKIGKPTGVGGLIILLVAVMFAGLFVLMQKLGVPIYSSFSIKEELNVIFFTFISFGVLGLYDDLVKVFKVKMAGPMDLGQKLISRLVLSIVVASLLYFNLHINIINLPFYNVLHLGIWYLPLASLVILLFTYAFNATDGLDGLAGGLLLVCLLAFWALSVSALDTPLSVFISLWVGSLIAFLYFNVYPSRVWLGNAGGLAFGATLAVVGLLLGKIVAVVVIGGVFIAELGSFLLQPLWLKLTGKKLFPASPLHHWLLVVGWSESKIAQRAWLLGVMLAFFGLWLALV